jgi:putative heme-binding domain-containing protein
VSRPFLRVAGFTVAVVAVFAVIGETITRISGEGERHAAPAAGDVSPEAGEAIFWGKGKCATCHAVGSRGNAVRGPNQGEGGPLGLPIGARAEARARERSQATGRPYTAADYLVESLLEPGAYVVQGFKNEMPAPLAPPISLTADELRAVIAYLQSLGGTVDVAGIRLPAAALATARQAAAPPPWAPYLPGDAKKGEDLFFNADSNAACAKCHTVQGKGGQVGPELSHVAGTRDARFIVEAILDPSKEIASGYEPVLLVTREGQYLTGIIKREDAERIEILDNQARTHTVPKSAIAQRSPQTTSLMPGNFREILTVEEFHDLLAFVLSLK